MLGKQCKDKNNTDMEKEFMTQEELDNSIEIGDVIETDKGEKLKCVGKENGVPMWEYL